MMSYEFILYKQFCFFVLYCTVLYRVQHYGIFISSLGRKCKSSSDVTGTSILFKVLYCKIENVLFSVFAIYVQFV